MKKDIYAVIVIILKLVWWLLLQKLSDFYQFWKNLLSLRQFYANMEASANPLDKMYNFRPYELTKVDYKCYKGLFDKGINTYPKPRSGHRIVCNDSDLFCFGGFNPDIVTEHYRAPRPAATTQLFQELWRFDTLTLKWRLLLGPRDGNVMPPELASNAVCMKEEMIVIFGGTGFPFGHACSNKCFLFWPYKEPKTISMLETTGSKPTPQYGQSTLLRGRHLYVIGGTTGFEYSCDIYRLDLITKEWECINMCREENIDDPKGRYRHEIAYDEQFIYVLGGGTSTVAYSLEQLPAFNMELCKWEYIKTKPDPMAPLPGIPNARKCHSCVQYKTDNGDIELVIAGGYYEDSQFFNDIWKLNLTTFRWHLYRSATLPYPLYFHDAATSGNGLMYLFGGIEVRDEQMLNKTRTNEVYKMWVTIPKLSEISWHALLAYDPKLLLKSRNELCAAGIPQKFVNRIDRSDFTSQ